MKKVLSLITQSEYGGAQRYIFDLANNLKAGYEMAVAFGEQGNNGKLAKILTENNIKYFIIPQLKRNLSPLNDLLAFFKIIKLIKNYRPDIIHLNSSKISILGSIAAFVIKLGVRSYELRVVYTVHGWVFNEPLPGWLKYFYLWAEKFTARFKDKIICVSEYDRQIAIKYKISVPDKLITIHNGLTPINFYSKKTARQKISLTPSVKEGDIGSNLLIGSIGNLYKTKGYEYFVQAAEILVNQHHLSATFIIIGDGAERKNLEVLIKKYRLENIFILAGSIDEAARLLPALDIYVCSSVKEGLSYTLIEAMQAGLPIVATGVGGNHEIIANPSANSTPRTGSGQDGSQQSGSLRPELGEKAGQATGLLVRPAEANELAKKIITLLNNKALAAELGRSAKIKAAAKFGLKKMVEDTKLVYNKLSLG